jgi:hypothetical protein
MAFVLCEEGMVEGALVIHNWSSSSSTFHQWKVGRTTSDSKRLVQEGPRARHSRDVVCVFLNVKNWVS